MVHEASPPAPLSSIALPVVAGLFSIAVFAIDTLSPLGTAVAVLYVVVVLLAVNFLPRRGVLLVALGCAVLAVSSHLLQHGESGGAPVARLFVSLAAIGITTFLVLKNQSAAAVLYEQARLLDLTHDTIFVRDMNDVITYWNRGAEALYGFRSDVAIGETTHRLLQTVFPAPLEEINAELLRSGRWEGELGHTKRDGERLVVASRWALQRDDRGRPVGILETNTDITDRKRAEGALQATQAELAHVSRVTTLGEFTASIAHEVNQPLAAIVTNGEVCLRLLDQEMADLAAVREAVGDMIGNGRRAGEIIRRLRALSKKTETHKAATDINDVINEVIPLVQQQMLNQRVSLRLELAPTLPAVLGDRVQLQQVIINLVLNGMEAMETVIDRQRELVIRSQGDGTGQVVVAVQDTGVGIDPDNVKQLFDAFFTTKLSGMGMGLSICRSIVANHGGTLSAAPNPGPGATFQFTLPSHREALP